MSLKHKNSTLKIDCQYNNIQNKNIKKKLSQFECMGTLERMKAKRYQGKKIPANLFRCFSNKPIIELIFSPQLIDLDMRTPPPSPLPL